MIVVEAKQTRTSYVTKQTDWYKNKQDKTTTTTKTTTLHLAVRFMLMTAPFGLETAVAKPYYYTDLKLA